MTDTETLLLEREGLLGALSEHLTAVCRGTGRLVLLHGEAGVGKTSVLNRFACTVDPATDVLVGWCDPLSTPRPLGPWLDIAPGLGIDVEPDPADGLPGVFRRITAALAARDTTVLALEDLHWADAASLDLLGLLARRLSRYRALVVGTYRDDELAPDHPLRVLFGHLAGMPGTYREPIEPLSQDAVVQLAADGTVDPTQLYRVTGGNPFYVTEVLAAGGEHIPATVTDAVTARLGPVSPAARHIAEAVAILGSPAPTGLVTGLTGLALTAADELVSSGLLQASGTGLGFRHELARVAMLDAISAARRATLHARALDLLERDPARRDDHAVLAHHAEAAGNVHALLIYAPAAAADAVAAGAYREAASQSARVLPFADDLAPDDRATLLELFAQASTMANQLEDASNALRAAVELRREARNRRREGDDSRWLSLVLYPLGRYAEAVEAGERAVQVLEELPQSYELAGAYANMCLLSMLAQDGVMATRRFAERAVAVGRRFDNLDAVWEAQFCEAMAHYRSADGADADTARGEAEAARDAALGAGLVDTASFVTVLLGLIAATHREGAAADAAHALLNRMSTDRELPGHLGMGSAQHAYRLMQRGLWDQATGAAAAILDHPAMSPMVRVLPLAVLGLIRARRGDPEAGEPLDEALSVFEPSMTLISRACRAEAAWLEGDHDRALAEARLGLEATTAHTDPWLTGELARWVVLAGGEPPPVRAAGPFTCEVAGDWREAADGWEQLGCRYDAALARLAGDVPALLWARQTFAELGARPAERLAAARLRALGVRSGARGPRAATRANPHRLTSRQLEILQLVSEGLTGPQIAARLYLSPKTVDRHISAATATLGVNSRAAAARAVFGDKGR